MIIVVLLASYIMLGIELLYAYFNTSSSDIAEVYEDSDWDLEYFLEKELLVLLDAFAVRGVRVWFRTWCSSVVFEREVREVFIVSISLVTCNTTHLYYQ